MAAKILAPAEAPTQVMLAGTWDRQRDLAGWMASEKWDGVRAYWTGAKFLSRNGNVYNPPDWFVKDLPLEPLDGELWLGRGKFHECSGICRRAIPRAGGAEWKKMRYIVFDAPGMNAPFRDRMAHAAKLVKDCEYAQATQQIEIPGNDVLPGLLAIVEKQGGEGLIARDPESRYERTRSQAMLKITTRERAEVTVTGYEPGEGANEGVMGAVTFKMANGIDGKVGTGFTYRQRQNPPRIGATITIAFKGLDAKTKKPREPSYVGMRNYE